MSFIATLQNIRDGALVAQLTENLQDVVEAVSEHRKVGKLVITLTIKPNGDEAVTVSPSVKATKPEASVGDAMFFVSEGNLVRRNPRQMDIEDELARRRGEKESG